MTDETLKVSSIQSTYPIDDQTGDILLKNGKGRLQVGKTKIACLVTARMRFLPEQGIYFDCEFAETYGLSPYSIATEGKRLKIDENFFEVIPVSIIPRHTLHNTVQCTYILKCKATVTGTDLTDIDTMTLHIFGFNRFSSHKTFNHVEGTNRTHVSYVVCELGEYRLILRELLKQSDATKRKSPTASTWLSHVAQLMKRDGSTFTPKKIEKYIRALGMTLSFMRGAAEFGLLSVGFRSNDIVFESWPILNGEHHNHDNWFDLHYHPDSSTSYFEEIFPLIYAQIESEADEVFWGRIIMTYCQANSVTYVPNAIILIQVALETMSHRWKCTQSEKAEPSTSCDSVKTTGKIRDYLCREGIPIELSYYDPVFAERFRNKGFSEWDVVRLLCDIRNSYVHADNNGVQKFNLSADESMRVLHICLLVLEYAILRKLGYSGYYRNRLSHAQAGTVELVPWDEARPS